METQNQEECRFEKMAEELYNMKCLEFKRIEEKPGSNFSHRFSVLRVPGGWLFYDYNENKIFVPFNNEFQKTK